MTEYRLVAEPRADLDVAPAFDWYENEEAGLGRSVSTSSVPPTIGLPMARSRTEISAPAFAGRCSGASRTLSTSLSNAT